MNKTDHAGIEVSQEELLVALRREEQTLPLQSFPNIPEGHRAVVRYLARQGRRVQVCLESTGVYGLDVSLLLHQRPGRGSDGGQSARRPPFCSGSDGAQQDRSAGRSGVAGVRGAHAVSVVASALADRPASVRAGPAHRGGDRSVRR